MGPTWGPSGSCRPQMGPMLAPWTMLSGVAPYTPFGSHLTENNMLGIGLFTISISPSLGYWNKPQTGISENRFWLLDRNYTTVHLLWSWLFRVQFSENYHIPVSYMALFKSMGSLQSHPKKHFMENSVENNEFSLTNCTWLSSVILWSFCQEWGMEWGGCWGCWGCGGVVGVGGSILLYSSLSATVYELTHIDWNTLVPYVLSF